MTNKIPTTLPPEAPLSSGEIFDRDIDTRPKSALSEDQFDTVSDRFIAATLERSRFPGAPVLDEGALTLQDVRILPRSGLTFLFRRESLSGDPRKVADHESVRMSAEQLQQALSFVQNDRGDSWNRAQLAAADSLGQLLRERSKPADVKLVIDNINQGKLTEKDVLHVIAYPEEYHHNLL